MSKVKVLLADDHAIVLEGLRAVLSTDEDLDVVAELGNGQEVLDYLESNTADVAVLDINMPRMDGLSCAKMIKSKYPQVKVVILTMYSQKSFVEEIIKIGVEGCLLKNNTGKELTEAIHRVAEGRNYYDRIKTFVSESEEIAPFKFSEREIEIIRHLARGCSALEIADKLFISENTVKTHKKNIMRKASVHSTAQLINFAINNQII
ncbi:MAG TPA: response regulator transcription factor [Cyclobacteriaceae bacterium]|nr:response regulator transcription factor [Cyclobacteriaceae bacterium]